MKHRKYEVVRCVSSERVVPTEQFLKSLLSFGVEGFLSLVSGSGMGPKPSSTETGLVVSLRKSITEFVQGAQS